MRIALDASYSVGSNLTGIGVYSEKLLTGLAAAHPGDDFLFCYRPRQFWRSAPARFPNVRRRLLQTPLPIPGAELFHALNQRVDRRPAPRVVSTFHDLFVMTAEYSTAEFRRRFAAQAAAAADRSDLIITVSDFTANQVSELLHVEPARIRVIPHGVDLPPGTPDDDARENMILFVGALQTRKNLVRLIDAFERLPGAWRLVLAGSSTGYGGQAILDRIAQSSACSRIKLAGHLPHAALDDLYRRARIFAFASLDEGFGIPVLEAMAHGVPVVTSNRSSLPEVAGGAAVLVDPLRSDEIAGALLDLIQNPARRSALAASGRARAAEFPWSRAVEMTYRVYCELLG